MSLQNILEKESWKEAVKFHGHMCPGLSIGYRAAVAGMERFHNSRSSDEEIVTIVETNACGTDAIQCITGCTFGKGNLIFKDHGKHVFTFVSRSTGQGTRVSLKPNVLEPDERHLKLFELIRSETATAQEKEEFFQIHHNKSVSILEKEIDELFDIREVEITLPPKAKIEPSLICDECGEPTMASKTGEIDNRRLCPECMARVNGCS